MFYGRNTVGCNMDEEGKIAPGKTPEAIVEALENTMREVSKSQEFAGDVKKVWGYVDFIDGKTVMQKIVPGEVSRVNAVLQSLGLGK